jgi:hypothetical protein
MAASWGSWPATLRTRARDWGWPFLPLSLLGSSMPGTVESTSILGIIGCPH